MTISNKIPRIIISGGGTGGHIFPAIAIANALKKVNPLIEILFVGAEGKMEMEKVPAAGFAIQGLPIAGFKRSFSLSNLSFPLKLFKSLSKAKNIIKDFNPDVAVGVGGYASGPLLYIAGKRKIPFLIQEQNSFPGITNKILSKDAGKVCVAYEGMDKYFNPDKLILTGNPVRSDIKQIDNKKTEAANFFNLDENRKTILVIGGSQGARSINQALLSNLLLIKENDLQLIWQTGKHFIQQANEAVQKLDYTNIKVFEFISRMDYAYAMADVVISRAGASTVSELCIVGKPAIMIPLPTAAEDHQTKNCEAMVKKNAAILIKDENANQQMVQQALDLIHDETRCKTFSKNLLTLAKPNAAEEIALEVLKLIKA